MKYYKTKASVLYGNNYKEIYKKARRYYKRIEKQTKRKPYIRSAFFRGEKVFFDYYWKHLLDKRRPDRIRRLRFFACALELIRNSRVHPNININRNWGNEIFYQFYGVERGGEKFFVQIKENKKQARNILSPVFPKNSFANSGQALKYNLIILG